MDARRIGRPWLSSRRQSRPELRSFDSYAGAQAEALLRAKQERFSPGQQARRTLITEVTAAAGFLLAAAAVAGWGPGGRELSVPALLAVGVTFLAARRVRFPVGSASTWPAQLVFIPMLFILPLRGVALIGAALILLDLAPRLISSRPTREQAVTRLASSIGDCWYMLGPVAVLLAFSAQRFTWSHWPIYILAFAAQVGLDLASGLLRTWFAERIVPRQQTQMVWLYLTDAALSCIGLQCAALGVRRPGLVLLELPVIGLLGMFARERGHRMQGTLELSNAYRGTVLLLGDVLEGDDEYTGVHSRAVVDLSLAVSDRLGLNANARQRVEFAALLHDVGKIREPKEILHKAGPLNDAEWAVMRLHTVYGEEMLRQVGGTLADVGQVVRATHERWDGDGYPDGLKGAEIPVEARIVAACDAYNAMTTDRPYRTRMSNPEAMAELQRVAGAQFDAAVVAALLEEIRPDQPLPALSDQDTAVA
jgi:HD-GYP domain-containing protein (c-di-GMP phosphodiesterase class II)